MTSGRPAAARSRLGRLDRAKLARCSRRLTPPGRAGTHSGAAHGHARAFLARVASGAIAVMHPPLRIVGRRRDHADAVSAGGQPFGHLRAVLADAGQFGGVVDAVDQDLHARSRPRARTAGTACRGRSWRAADRERRSCARPPRLRGPRSRRGRRTRRWRPRRRLDAHRALAQRKSGWSGHGRRRTGSCAATPRRAHRCAPAPGCRSRHRRRSRHARRCRLSGIGHGGAGPDQRLAPTRAPNSRSSQRRNP